MYLIPPAFYRWNMFVLLLLFTHNCQSEGVNIAKQTMHTKDYHYLHKHPPQVLRIFLKLSEFSIHFYDFIVPVVTVVELRLVKLCTTTTNINDALVVIVNWTTDFYTPSFLIIHMTQHFTTAYEWFLFVAIFFNFR